MTTKPIRLSLDVSPELNSILDKMAQKTHSSKSEVLRKSIALMEVAIQEKDKGNHLGVVGKDQKVLKEIVGL
jgi:predicted transcriptional regulator